MFEGLLLAEVWYRCGTCKYDFPASELSAHQGHNFWPIDVQTER